VACLPPPPVEASAAALTGLHSALTALISMYFFELLYCFLADCTD
jgi:hypothetical protein